MQYLIPSTSARRSCGEIGVNDSEAAVKTMQREQDNHALRTLVSSMLALGFITIPGASSAGPILQWQTVVNNGYFAPGSTTDKFFSYNQPSVNDAGLVVFRARAKPPTGAGGGGGAGEPTRGVFTRDMSIAAQPIVPVAVSGVTVVPSPNNLGSTFTEFPAFPRIDAASNTLAFRGQSQPVLEYQTGAVDPATNEPITSRAGTSGVYTNPSGALVTGASQLGAVPFVGTNPDLRYFQVPTATGVPAGTKFDQFPGAPSPTGSVVTFKGNYTNPDPAVGGQTGVFYRDVSGSGTSPVQVIAHSGDGNTHCGDTHRLCGKRRFSARPRRPVPQPARWCSPGSMSRRPRRRAASSWPRSPRRRRLQTIAGFNTVVPGKGPTTTLNGFGEGLSFDGRYVGFWGAWGTDTMLRTLICPTDGNAAVIAACIAQDTSGTAGDGIYTVDVPSHQGIFLADTLDDQAVARRRARRSRHRRPPVLDVLRPSAGCRGIRGGRRRAAALEIVGLRRDRRRQAGVQGPRRWRCLRRRQFHRRTLRALRHGRLAVDDSSRPAWTAACSTRLPPGYRSRRSASSATASADGWLAINASMTDGEDSWAGIYVTQVGNVDAQVPEPGTLALVGLGAVLLPLLRRRRA